MKLNMAHITSLLEQTLKKISSEGLSNWPMIFSQAQATIQPEEGMSGQGSKPHYNMVFMQLTIPALALTIVDASANESYKNKYSEDIEYDKIVALEATCPSCQNMHCSKYGCAEEILCT